MKAWIIFLIIVAALAVTIIVVVNQWCATPHGRLDWRAAVVLKYIKVAKIELFRESDPPDESRRINREKSRPFKGRPPDLAGSLPLVTVWVVTRRESPDVAPNHGTVRFHRVHAPVVHRAFPQAFGWGEDVAA